MPKTYKDVANKISLILKKYSIREAYLFGSYARGENTSKSDIDVLIRAPKGITLFTLAAIELELEDKLKKPVDVVTIGSLSPLLKKHIEKDQIPLIL